jgi:hypothetical protein
MEIKTTNVMLQLQRLEAHFLTKCSNIGILRQGASLVSETAELLKECHWETTEIPGLFDGF